MKSMRNSNAVEKCTEKKSNEDVVTDMRNKETEKKEIIHNGFVDGRSYKPRISVMEWAGSRGSSAQLEGTLPGLLLLLFLL